MVAGVVVGRARLARQVRRALQDHSQITLLEVCELYPLERGLAELVVYLQLAGEGFGATVDETVVDSVSWRSAGADDAPVLRTRVAQTTFRGQAYPQGVHGCRVAGRARRTARRVPGGA